MPRPKVKTDHIGNFGELLAGTDLSRPVGGRYRPPPLFARPIPLGDKHPVLDYLVDVLGPDGYPVGFFFTQIKSTSRASELGDRLSIPVEKGPFNALVRSPVPTYLIGVDTSAEACYIVCPTTLVLIDVPSIVRAYNLQDEPVKIDLYLEVVEFWKRNKRRAYQTRFPHA